MALPALLPGVADRFLRYAQIDTQSDSDSDTVPSTETQLRLGELLADELRELGATDVEHDEPGDGVEPQIHEDYDGGVIDLRGDGSVVLDGGGRDVLYTETFFAARARLTVEGEMVHPGYAKDRMVNALRIVAEFVDALPETESPEHTEGREGYFYPHRSPEASAYRAAVDVLLRDFTADGLDRRRSLIRRQADYLQTRYPDAGIELEIEDQDENMAVYIEELEPRVITVAQRAAETMGIELRLDHVRGGTDGSRLSARGLPTPNVFTGGHAFHSRKEWNTVENLERALAFAEALVYAWGEEAT